MKPATRYVTMAALALTISLFLGVEDLKAQIRENGSKAQKIEMAIEAQRNYNIHNKKRIAIKARIVSILSARSGSLHIDPSALAEIIMVRSEQHRLDPFLILGMIQAESGFNSRAVSNQGALGLMQIKPDTASLMAPHLDFDEGSELLLKDHELNISLGTMYLAKMVHRFGNMKAALEAYNRGPMEVSRDISEGDLEADYAERVTHYYHRFKGA